MELEKIIEKGIEIASEWVGTSYDDDIKTSYDDDIKAEATLLMTPIGNDISASLMEIPSQRVLASGSIGEVIETAKSLGYLIPRQTIELAQQAVRRTKSPKSVTLVRPSPMTLGPRRLPGAKPVYPIQDLESLGNTLLVAAIRSQGYDTFIDTFTQSYKLANFSNELIFFDKDKQPSTILGNVTFDTSYYGYILSVELRVSVIPTVLKWLRGAGAVYTPSTTPNDTALAYEILRHVLETGQLTSYKRRGNIENISLAGIKAYDTFASTSVAQTDASGNSTEILQVYRNGQLYWRHTTFKLGPGAGYQKQYGFVPGDPVSFKLNVDKSLLEDTLVGTTNNLDRIRQLTGYITLIIRVLRTVAKS